ncbi:MAG: CehA/McbA family metallohydrolase, partial [Firmicutes bacterium]|nr:CehA/McbA family metallohydrolase [Bacillota bacterium]
MENNIKNQTLQFWEFDKEQSGEVQVVSIETALAASSGEFTVKGVVTLVDGANIYIQDDTGGICLYFAEAPSGINLGDTLQGTGNRTTYKGLPELAQATAQKVTEGTLTLTPKETTLSALTNADICTYVSIKDLTVTAISGDNTTVTDANGNSINIYKAVSNGLAVDDTIDFTGAVGMFNSMQLRNTLASEITVYVDPYDEVDHSKNVYELTGELTDGDKVLIYNAGYSKAVTSTIISNYYLEGKDYTTEIVSENKIIAATPEDAAVTEWTVAVNTDGTYTFTQGDKTLGGVVSGTHNNLAVTGATYTTWTLEVCNETNNSFYMYNPGMTASSGHVYLEWYNNKSDFSLYATSNVSEGAFGMTFFKLVRPASEEPGPATGDTFGLASTLNTGDEVILYNAGSGTGLGNTIANYKIQGVALTPAEGVITTDNTNVVWTVTKNEDGTYTFTQGTNTLGGVVSGTHNNLVVTGATATNWTLTGPDSEDFNYYMYLGDMTSNFGNVYLEYYNGFTLYGSNAPEKGAYGITFYKKGAEPETPSGPAVEGDLITSLSQLTDGATVAIYSPTHKTAISSKANGDWYLKANPAIVEDGKVKDFTSDFVWKVKVNDNGTYSFYSNDKEGDSISVWPSVVNGKTYAELTVNTNYDEQTVNEWVLSPFNSQNHTWYVKSSTLKISNRAVYVEAYVRNGGEVFSGYAPYPDEMTDTNYALQFYLVDPADAVAEYDDGEWDGILTEGEQYVMYSDAAKASVGLFKEANYSMDAIPTTIVGDKANPGNGAYVFTVGTTGRYYTFEVGGKYLASNDEEELLFVEANEDGSIPGTAKWYLYDPEDSDGYVVFNKTANYKGSPVCIEYYSSVFSGWTYKPKAEDTSIFYFDFYKVTEDTDIHEGVVQDPSVIFDCEDSRYIEQDYPVTITLDDLADEITDIEIIFTAGSKTGTITDYEVSSDGKNYTFTIPASEIDVEEGLESFELNVNVVNSYGIEYEGSKTVAIVDEPFFEDLTPAPNSQTRDDKRPVVSARVGNVGEEPTFTLKLNDEVITDIVYENGILSYTPTEDMEDGRVNVLMTVTRKDGVSAEKSWNFTVGISDYQLYFGQLHSHTTYSDGSGTLETALDYIGSLPESANVQFVAFTDHSNYFDAPNAANPADALNDKSLMTEGSLADWNTYKETIAAFNDKQSDVIAIGGFEMTWSGGPGHINTYDSDGLVSRNNALLNNKTNDAGMKLYYETINKGESLNQFNHPGTTFGNFTDFSYWNEETDSHMFLVEVGNGEGQIGAGGYYPSYEQYTLALDQGWHLAPTNNQDNHKGRWGNANDARDVILTNDFSEEGIYNAIRDLRVYATEDKNLQISYTMNDEPMGTIFTEENTPETLNTVITVYDPNNYDGTAKVELVANGGVVAKTWDSAEELAEGLFTAELTPEYGYYFVRVTQEDGDIAVTAPIWTGLDVAVGIKEVNVATEQPLVNQPMTINTTLFNNEEDAVNVKSLTYTVDGSTVIGTDTDGHPIAAGDEITVPFQYTPTVAKRMTVTVTAVFTVGDKEVTYSKDVTFSVRENDGDLPVTDIDVVNSQTEAGYEYAIEGIVTSNASGYDKDTAFFDCIYVQDATGGICCFPVSG